MSDFNISPRDQLRNPGKIFEEINKFNPNGLTTSRHKQGRNPMGLTMFNLSEILMRTPAYDSPENTLGRFESIITGVLGSFWDPENLPGLERLLPADLVDILDAANPDGFGSDGSEEDYSGGSDFNLGQIDSRNITPSTKPLGVSSRTKPVARFGAQIAREMLGFGGTIGGYSYRGPNSTSDHQRGYALDLMVSSGKATGKQKQMGDLIAAFFIHNRAALRVKYVIWYESIWSDKQDWAERYYERGRGKGATWKHQDHPHISFRDGPAPNNPDLEWPPGMITGSSPVNTNSSSGRGTAVAI